MKKITHTFTFWFFILSLFIIFMNIIGQDAKNLILIGFNPLLNRLPYDMMNNGIQIPNHSISGSISIYWYLASIISMCLYGLFLDFLRYLHHTFTHRK